MPENDPNQSAVHVWLACQGVLLTDQANQLLGPCLHSLNAAQGNTLIDANDDIESTDRGLDELLESLSVLLELQADPATLLGVMLRFQQSVQSDSDNDSPLPVPHELVELNADARKICQQLERISELELDYDPRQTSTEGLRRLLLALVTDVRVVLATLASRLVRLRHLFNQRLEDDDFVSLVSAIHAPLANRLGVWQVKWELEDLVFRYQQPDAYQKIAGLIAEKRQDREEYIDRLVSLMLERLAAARIEADVKGRPKHIFSIWKKMSGKGRSFDELYDVRAIRILVQEVEQCYAVLGLVHALWQPVPGEFVDYIANPKGNQYQSLHTAVFGPEGKTVEIQIRTQAMHEHAELGVAAHWQYKEGGKLDSHYQHKVNWMRHLLEGHPEDSEQELLDEFAPDNTDERIYVLTPKGDVIDLRAGATVLDFAYHVHTDVGHQCRGAKINGRIMPLDTVLKHGQRVDILTARNAEPSRDWMVPRLGYLNSARARTKVRQWFRFKDRDRNIAEGKDILERELKRLAVRPRNLNAVLKRFKLPDLDSLYIAVGVHDISVGQIAAALNDLATIDDPVEDSIPLVRTPPASTESSADGILIEGVGRLMTNMAKCCNPVPGDAIVGFITRTRGVSIHRSDCPNLSQLMATESERMIDVSWRNQANERYQAEIAVTAYNRHGLIRDIGHVLSTGGSDVTSMQTTVNEQDGLASFQLSVRVRDFEHLSLLVSRLQSMSNIIDVRRTG